MLLFACTYDCQQTQPEFKVLDGEADEVTGTVVSLTSAGNYQWVAWKPVHPFVADATYTVAAAEPRQRRSWTFDTKRAPAALEPVQLTFLATPTIAGVGGSVCCTGSPHTMWCHGDPCFQTQRQDAVSLALKAASIDDPAHNAGAGTSPPGFDFLYRTTFRSGTETVVMPDAPTPSAQLTSLTAADQYCYSLDAIRLATGEVIHVADACQALGLTSFVVRAPTDKELRYDLGQCADAPPGYEADWTRFGLGGASGSSRPPSAGATKVDASVAHDLDQDAHVQGAANGTTDAGSAVTPAPSRADSGCSLTQGTQAPHSLLMFLLTLSLSRRTRRSRGC